MSGRCATRHNAYGADISTFLFACTALPLPRAICSNTMIDLTFLPIIIALFYVLTSCYRIGDVLTQLLYIVFAFCWSVASFQGTFLDLVRSAMLVIRFACLRPPSVLRCSSFLAGLVCPLPSSSAPYLFRRPSLILQKHAYHDTRHLLHTYSATGQDHWDGHRLPSLGREERASAAAHFAQHLDLHQDEAQRQPARPVCYVSCPGRMEPCQHSTSQSYAGR